MKKSIGRVLSFLMVSVLFALTAASCSETTENPEDTARGTTTGTDNNPPGTTGTAAYIPPISDFLGEEFNILLRSTSWTPEDVWSEGENGEILNDAVYRRNRKIEELYNISIKAQVAGEATGSALNSFIESYVLAGEAPYDLVMIRVSDAALLSQKGLLKDLLNLEPLDFTQDCWQYDKLMSTTVNGRLFYATGLATNAANALNVCFFNKEIAESYDIGDLYDVTRTGKFTVDRMYEAARMTAKDLDGDGTMTKTDQFGVSAQSSLARMLLYSSDEIVVGKDKNDYPTLVIGAQRSFDVYDKISALMSDSAHIFIGETADMKAMFFEERALFYYASLSNAMVMRQYDFDFGLLPLPKFDESQEDYKCYLGAHNPCGTCIPVTSDSEKSAAILQAIAYYSKEEVIPAYYDTCLTGKSLRDDESSEMLDIIFGSWIIDLADAYNWAGVSSYIGNAIYTNTGLASAIESIKGATEAAIANTVKAYEGFKS